MSQTPEHSNPGDHPVAQEEPERAVGENGAVPPAFEGDDEEPASHAGSAEGARSTGSAGSEEPGPDYVGEEAPGEPPAAESERLSVLAEPGGLPAALEAILMVADTPVSAAQLASVLAVPQDQVQAALEGLVGDYTEGGRGFELREAAGGWRFYSAPRFAPAVDSFVLDGQTARLTQASLETLAVIAYRQPVSRGRIAAIRGVNVDSVVRTLLTRGLIEEAGQDEEGGAMMYRTSTYFLERLGLRSLDDLPPLAPYLPDLDTLDDIDGALR